MPELKLHFDTSILPTDVLSLCDGPFYEIVQKIAGEGEAKLLQVQGIRTINTVDLSSFASFAVYSLLSFFALYFSSLKKSSKMFRTYPSFVLPDNVLSLEGAEFFELVNRACGAAFKDLMKLLSINSVYKLLTAENDILLVFQKKYRELETIYEGACLHLEDGTMMLKPGLRLDFDRFITALRAANVHNQPCVQVDSSEDNLQSLLRKFKDSCPLNINNSAQKSYSFLIDFIENILSNLLRNKNNYRYSKSVQDFAHALYILGGRNVYEFMRMNLPGALPGLTAVNDSLRKAGESIEEGVFRYNTLLNNQKVSNYHFAVCSEDSTAVIRKINYAAATNTFTGFTTPLENGIPVSRHFQTDSFDQLRTWFENNDKADHLNIHMIQPLVSSNPYSSPFLLAAYGISNDFKSIDVLNRWMRIFEDCKRSNVQILSFATDCDPRYLLAMRLATGFFAKYINASVINRNDIFEIRLPRGWSSWFFMPCRQAFFCFQDPVHLCTKIRNRMLSKTATLLIGNGEVSTSKLIDLILTKTKFVHGLVKTDIEPKDRQNFSSCVRIASDDVLLALEDIDDSKATQIYLRLLRSIIIAYVDHSTPISERIYHA
ncbi:unnamed protein product [Adineta ricciae]|uniref:Uncharacterized protein n=1 Tax=Adineta ricciae TaxID=249248 RepID=A0A815WQK7_ADIRI|nr:unnamed protein product [Adineta ricciae]